MINDDIQPFPITEAFGFPADAATLEARAAQQERRCPFANNPCEKFRQYGYGNCSVTYSAADDQRQRQTYAVCDHRLDGPPIHFAVHDHFGTEQGTQLVPEVVLTDPRMSFDYVAVTRREGRIDQAVVIESQAVDLRGGGVGPAWRAWMEGKPHLWREYFSTEAKLKGRKDNVAYGVNLANIYKRLAVSNDISKWTGGDTRNRTPVVMAARRQGSVMIRASAEGRSGASRAGGNCRRGS